MTLGELNALDASRAGAEFLRCCGSPRWASAMAAARPFGTLSAMQEKGDAIWASLDRSDWLEAFAAHPKIGALEAVSAVSAWSAAEQAGMDTADTSTAARLSALNADYEARFGYIFIVCATGKSPGEMLALLAARMHNAPDDELQIAAAEQRAIAGLRLAKLVDGHE